MKTVSCSLRLSIMQLFCWHDSKYSQSKWKNWGRVRDSVVGACVHRIIQLEGTLELTQTVCLIIVCMRKLRSREGKWCIQDLRTVRLPRTGVMTTGGVETDFTSCVVSGSNSPKRLLWSRIAGLVSHSCHSPAVRPWTMCLTFCACCLHLQNRDAEGTDSWVVVFTYQMHENHLQPVLEVAGLSCGYHPHHHHRLTDLLHLSGIHRPLDTNSGQEKKYTRLSMKWVDCTITIGESVYWRQCKTLLWLILLIHKVVNIV